MFLLGCLVLSVCTLIGPLPGKVHVAVGGLFILSDVYYTCNTKKSVSVAGSSFK